MPVFLGVSAKDQIAEKNRVQNPNFLRVGPWLIIHFYKKILLLLCRHSWCFIYSECPLVLHTNSSKYICASLVWKLYITASSHQFWILQTAHSLFQKVGKCVLSLLSLPLLLTIVLKQRRKESRVEFQLLKIWDGNKKPTMSEISRAHYRTESVQKWFESHAATLLGIFMIPDLSDCHRWAAINQQGSILHSFL